MGFTPSVSIIIPISNEARIIEQALIHFSSLGADQVIVVDGASSDGTEEIIRGSLPWVDYFKLDAKNRSLQLNRGAKESTSDVFLFVHADMELPENAIKKVRSAIKAGHVAGGFEKMYDPQTPLLSFYSKLLNRIYFKRLQRVVGTNGIFVTRRHFEFLEGFPIVPFMEDVVFSNDLKKLGKLACIEDKVIVSSRRYLKKGIVKQIFLNAKILFGYFILKKKTHDLAELYNGKEMEQKKEMAIEEARGTE